MSERNPQNEGQFRVYDAMFLQAYKLYMSKLNPNCSKLFQHPNTHFREGVHWYKERQIGPRYFDRMMNKVCKRARLSRQYKLCSLKSSTNGILLNLGINPKSVTNTDGKNAELRLNRLIKAKKEQTLTVSNEKRQQQSVSS